MKLTYDRKVDAAYIDLGDSRAAGRVTTREGGDGIALDFDAERRLVGIEALDASRHLRSELLAAVAGAHATMRNE